MSVQVQLDTPDAQFTNLQFITGRVILTTQNSETISAIVVKLEGESRTLLGESQFPVIEHRGGTIAPRGRDQVESEVHMVLYKVLTVFPSRELQRAAPENPSYTLAAGQYEYPFRFQIPLENDCTAHSKSNLNMAGLLGEVVMPSDRHVKKTLPPSLNGLPGQAEITYFVKTTVQRPAFYKENFRARTRFRFLPIEPPRGPQNRRESFARRQHQFAPKLETTSKSGLFRQPSVPSPTATEAPPKVSLDGRLPDPAIINCNKSLPLRILVTKLNNSSATIYLQLLTIELLGYSEIRAHHLRRTDVRCWAVMSLSDLRMPLGGRTRNDPGKELEVDSKLWRQSPLHSTVAPSFETCNLSRHYALDIKVGLSYGTPDSINPELTVQTLRMPVQIYSGLALPSAPINRMNNRPMFPQNQTNANQSNSPHTPSTRPSQPHLSQPPHAHRPPTGQFGSSPDFSEEAPPSYDDAIADDAGPVDGLRRNYSQQHSTPSSVGGVNSSTKLKDERLFSNNET